MAKKVFFSFHYEPDNWRAGTIRSMGVVEGNPVATDNGWESIKKGGDPAIKNWIADEMSGRPCAIVLIGSATAGRKWIDYEINKAWTDGKGVLGLHIHKLLDSQSKPSSKGSNPFIGHTIGGVTLSNAVAAYDPAGSDSKSVYATISQNLETWIDSAIATRKQYK